MTVLVTLCVVDQVDAPGALVELVDGTFVDVPTACLPPQTQEGDVVRRRRPSARCPDRFGRAPRTQTRGRRPHEPRRLP